MSSSFPPARRAGPFVLTGGFDGVASGGVPGSIRQQCDHAYAALADALATHGLTAGSVVRLDHFTQSQGWLAERQTARADVFGRPAPLASTGVASRQRPGNLLTVAAIALADGAPEVLLPGDRYGMPAIATAMRAGDWLFVSGLLVRAPTDAVRQLREVLAAARLAPGALFRVDRYVADLVQAESVAAGLGTDGVASPVAVLPFADPDQLEITALATAAPIRRLASQGSVVVEAGGVAATGMLESSAADTLEVELEVCVERLVALLGSVGRGLGDVARLELCLSRIGDDALVRDRLAALLPEPRPALLVWGGGVGGRHLRLSAIAG